MYDNIIGFPLCYAHFEKEKTIVTLIWAKSSNRVVDMMGPAPYELFYQDANRARTRMVSTGWKEIDSGDVTR